MKKHRAVLLWAVLLGGWVAVCACGPVHPPTLPPTETDHTAQLQAAINKADSGEGPPIVWLEPGKIYNISAPLQTNGLTSFLCPSRSANLKWVGRGDLGSYMLRIGRGNAKIKISGIRFDGGGVASGIYAEKLTYGDAIEDCAFVSVVNGIHVLGSWGMVVEDCLFSTFSGFALRLEQHNGGRVTGCQFMWANGRDLAPGAAIFQVYGTTGTYERLHFECSDIGEGPLIRLAGRLKTLRDIYTEATPGGTRQSTVAIRIDGVQHTVSQIYSRSKTDPGIRYALDVAGSGHTIRQVRAAGFEAEGSAVVRIRGGQGDTMRVESIVDSSIERGVTPAEQLIREEP